jgi:hypothetical protein
MIKEPQPNDGMAGKSRLRIFHRTLLLHGLFLLLGLCFSRPKPFVGREQKQIDDADGGHFSSAVGLLQRLVFFSSWLMMMTVAVLGSCRAGKGRSKGRLTAAKKNGGMRPGLFWG